MSRIFLIISSSSYPYTLISKSKFLINKVSNILVSWTTWPPFFKGVLKASCHEFICLYNTVLKVLWWLSMSSVIQQSIMLQLGFRLESKPLYITRYVYTLTICRKICRRKLPTQLRIEFGDKFSARKIKYICLK